MWTSLEFNRQRLDGIFESKPDLKASEKAFLIGRFQRSFEPNAVFSLVTISLHMSLLTAIIIVVLANRTYNEINSSSVNSRGRVHCSDEFCVTAFYNIPYGQYEDGAFGFNVTFPPSSSRLQTNIHHVVLCPNVLDSKCLSMNVFMPSSVFNTIKMFNSATASDRRSNYDKFAPLVVVVRATLTNDMRTLQFEDLHKLAGRLQAVVALVAYRFGAPGFVSVNDDADHSSAALGDIKAAIRFLVKNHLMFGIRKERITLIGGGNAAILAAMNLMGHLESDPVVSTYIIQGGSPFSPEITQPHKGSLGVLQQIVTKYISRTDDAQPLEAENLTVHWSPETLPIFDSFIETVDTNTTLTMPTATNNSTHFIQSMTQFVNESIPVLLTDTLLEEPHRLSCDLDEVATVASYRVCLEQMNAVKLSTILRDLEDNITLLPRLGHARRDKKLHRKVLLGLTVPRTKASNVTESKAALSRIEALCKAHNQTPIGTNELIHIYGDTVDAKVALHDFVVTCPMYVLAEFLRNKVGAQVFMYVFDGKTTPVPPTSIPVDSLPLVDEATEFEAKRDHVRFQHMLKSFIDNTLSWPEWTVEGRAHVLFNGTQHVTHGFREAICDRWKRWFSYSDIEALVM